MQIEWTFSDGNSAAQGSGGVLVTLGSSTVTITAQNEAPTAIVLSASTIAENVTVDAGVEIGTLTVTDPDSSGNNNVLTLEGPDAASFSIASGKLVFTGSSPDFEAKPSYSVTVKGTDGALTFSQPFTVNVNVSNVNEAPTAIALSANTIAENVTVGAGVEIGTLTVTDPDASGNNNVLTLKGADAASFAIVADKLVFIGSSPDFGAKPGYSVTVKSTDGALTFSQGFTVNVSKVSHLNAAPTLSGVPVATQNVSVGTAVVSARIDIRVSDEGVAAAATYNLFASNVAPTGTGLPTLVIVTEDLPSTLDLSALTLADANGDALTLTLTASSGTLAATSGGSVTVAGTGTGRLTLFGSAASLNTFLGTLASVGYTSALNDNTARSIAASVSDGTHTAVNLGSTVVNITPVNDAPTLAGVPITAQTVSAGTAAALVSFTVADVDNASLTLTLTASNGSIGNLGDWSHSGSVYSKTDTADNLNTAILGASFTAAAAGAASIALSVSDGNAPAVVGNYSFTATAAPAPSSDLDLDGVPDAQENAVPGLMPANGGLPIAGDGNGDGFADSLQPGVVSSVFLNTPSAQSNGTNAAPLDVTLVADAKDGKTDSSDHNSATLSNLVQLDAPGDLPEGIRMPLGLLSFTVDVQFSGEVETFSLYLDAILSVNGYWKQDGTGTWVNLASDAYGGKIVTESGKTRLDFKLTDGGQFDADDTANGTIIDPGAAGFMPLSLVGYAPELPAGSHFWF